VLTESKKPVIYIYFNCRIMSPVLVLGLKSCDHGTGAQKLPGGRRPTLRTFHGVTAGLVTRGISVKRVTSPHEKESTH